MYVCLFVWVFILASRLFLEKSDIITSMFLIFPKYTMFRNNYSSRVYFCSKNVVGKSQTTFVYSLRVFNLILSN